MQAKEKEFAPFGDITNLIRSNKKSNPSKPYYNPNPPPPNRIRYKDLEPERGLFSVTIGANHSHKWSLTPKNEPVEKRAVHYGTCKLRTIVSRDVMVSSCLGPETVQSVDYKPEQEIDSNTTLKQSTDDPIDFSAEVILSSQEQTDEPGTKIESESGHDTSKRIDEDTNIDLQETTDDSASVSKLAHEIESSGTIVASHTWNMRPAEESKEEKSQNKDNKEITKTCEILEENEENEEEMMMMMMKLEAANEEVSRLYVKLSNVEEELRNKYEELRKRDEDLRKRDEEISRRDEELFKKDEEIKKTIEERNTQLFKKNEELRKKDIKLKAEKKEILKMNARLSKKDEELTKKDEDITEMKVELTKMGEELTKKNEEIKEAKEELEKEKQRSSKDADETAKLLTSKIKEYDFLQENYENATSDIQSKEREIGTLTKEISEMKEAWELQRSDSAKKLFSLQEVNSSLTKKMSALPEDKFRLQKEIQSLQDKSGFLNKYSSLKKKNHSLQKEVSCLEEENSDLGNEIFSLREEIDSLQHSRSSLTDLLTSLQKESNKDKEKLFNCQAVQDSVNLMFHEVKAVSKFVKANVSILGSRPENADLLDQDLISENFHVLLPYASLASCFSVLFARISRSRDNLPSIDTFAPKYNSKSGKLKHSK